MLRNRTWVPDPRWQEVPVAFVVSHPGSGVSDTALREFLAAQLARFKLPRRFVFVAALPRNALGKVQHFRLRDFPLRPLERRGSG